jgi:hypothetical protein
LIISLSQAVAGEEEIVAIFLQMELEEGLVVLEQEPL